MQSPIEQEIARQGRARNWAAVVAMGPAYKTVYLVIGIISLVLMVIGFISMFSNGPGTLLLIGFVLGLVVNGGMTIIANARQAFKKS